MRRDLSAYIIEGYYNRQRRHSAIGYITPENFRLRYGLGGRNHDHVERDEQNAGLMGLSTAALYRPGSAR